MVLVCRHRLALDSLVVGLLSSFVIRPSGLIRFAPLRAPCGRLSRFARLVIAASGGYPRPARASLPRDSFIEAERRPSRGKGQEVSAILGTSRRIA